MPGVHGRDAQEGSACHGNYRQHVLQSLHVCSGATHTFITAVSMSEEKARWARASSPLARDIPAYFLPGGGVSRALLTRDNAECEVVRPQGLLV